MPRHTVTVPHTAERTRAVCTCGWRSPIVTAGPPQPDVPPRTDYAARAVRAGEYHVRVAGSRT